MEEMKVHPIPVPGTVKPTQSEPCLPSQPMWITPGPPVANALQNQASDPQSPSQPQQISQANPIVQLEKEKATKEHHPEQMESWSLVKQTRTRRLVKAPERLKDYVIN